MTEIEQKSDMKWEDRPITITAGMWEELQTQNDRLRREIAAILHATGVKRFDPDLFDYESGEDKKRLAEYEFTDVYALQEEANMTKEKADVIFEYMIEQQKLCFGLQVFLLKTKHVCEIFGTSRRETAIKYMEQTEKIYRGRVIRQHNKGGPKGYWSMALTNDEISKIRNEI
jgi:hypothetical protein